MATSMNMRNKCLHLKFLYPRKKCITSAYTSNFSVREKNALQGLTTQIYPSQKKMHCKGSQLKFLHLKEKCIAKAFHLKFLHLKEKCITRAFTSNFSIIEKTTLQEEGRTSEAESLSQQEHHSPQYQAYLKTRKLNSRKWLAENVNCLLICAVLEVNYFPLNHVS